MNVGVLATAATGVAGYMVVADGSALLRQLHWRQYWQRFQSDRNAVSLTVSFAAAATAALLAGAVSKSAVFSLAAGICAAFVANLVWSSQQHQALDFLRLQQKLLLPQFLDVVQIAVGAGLAVRPAIQLATTRTHPLIALAWQPITADNKAERPLVELLEAVARADAGGPVARVAAHLLIATERGTPLAAVLSGLASEFRAESRRQLLEQAAKKDVQMMLPVVFGILPGVTVIALYPALTTLSSFN